MKYCFVKGCRFNNTHITSRHVCGNNCIFPLGHGRIECKNKNLFKDLEGYKNQIINANEQCTIKDCLDKYTHTTIGHNCLYCYKFNNNHLKYCPIIYNQEIQNEIDYEIHNEQNDLEPGYYKYIYGGQGSSIYMRRNVENNNIETLDVSTLTKLEIL